MAPTGDHPGKAPLITTHGCSRVPLGHQLAARRETLIPSRYVAVISPLRDERERIVGGTCVLHEITPEHLSESAQAQAERGARTLGELSGDMLVRTDPDGRYL